jgi:hypothetical protein
VGGYQKFSTCVEEVVLKWVLVFIDYDAGKCIITFVASSSGEAGIMSVETVEKSLICKVERRSLLTL